MLANPAKWFCFQAIFCNTESGTYLGLASPPNYQTSLVIVLPELPILLWYFTHTTDYHLGWYEPSSSATSCSMGRGLTFRYLTWLWLGITLNLFCFRQSRNQEFLEKSDAIKNKLSLMLCLGAIKVFVLLNSWLRVHHTDVQTRVKKCSDSFCLTQIAHKVGLHVRSDCTLSRITR